MMRAFSGIFGAESGADLDSDSSSQNPLGLFLVISDEPSASALVAADEN